MTVSVVGSRTHLRGHDRTATQKVERERARVVWRTPGHLHRSAREGERAMSRLSRLPASAAMRSIAQRPERHATARDIGATPAAPDGVQNDATAPESIWRDPPVRAYFQESLRGRGRTRNLRPGDTRTGPANASAAGQSRADGAHRSSPPCEPPDGVLAKRSRWGLLERW